MGGFLSTPSDPQNPNISSSSSSEPTNTTMPSLNPTQNRNSSTQTDPTHQSTPQQVGSDPPVGESIQSPQNDGVLGENQEKIRMEGEEEEEEEVGECGFCVFMKAGGCREPFIEWEKCVEEGEKNKEDIVEKCHMITKSLSDCMQAHQDYYGPVLQAEKELEEEAMKEYENRKEKEREKEGNVESTSGSMGGGDKESRSVSESVVTIEVAK